MSGGPASRPGRRPRPRHSRYWQAIELAESYGVGRPDTGALIYDPGPARLMVYDGAAWRPVER